MSGAPLFALNQPLDHREVFFGDGWYKPAMQDYGMYFASDGDYGDFPVIGAVTLFTLVLVDGCARRLSLATPSLLMSPIFHCNFHLANPCFSSLCAQERQQKNCRLPSAQLWEWTSRIRRSSGKSLNTGRHVKSPVQCPCSRLAAWTLDACMLACMECMPSMVLHRCF